MVLDRWYSVLDCLRCNVAQCAWSFKMPAIDQFGRPVAQDTSYRIGRFLSQIFHPIVNGSASFLVVGALASEFAEQRWRGVGWALLCIALLVTPTTVFFYYRMARGAFSDDDVSLRQQRNGLYVFALGSIVLTTLALYALSVPAIFLRLIGAAIGIILVCMLVNFVWKISVHSATIATLAMLSTKLLPPLGICLWIAAIAVGWARIRTGNHTLAQVVAGWTVAVAGVLLAGG
jgi:membrane-associated phospholipid phosphatase